MRLPRLLPNPIPCTAQPRDAKAASWQHTTALQPFQSLPSLYLQQAPLLACRKLTRLTRGGDSSSAACSQRQAQESTQLPPSSRGHKTWRGEPETGELAGKIVAAKQLGQLTPDKAPCTALNTLERVWK